MVLSVILSLIGWSATYEMIDPATHQVVSRRPQRRWREMRGGAVDEAPTNRDQALLH